MRAQQSRRHGTSHGVRDAEEPSRFLDSTQRGQSVQRPPKDPHEAQQNAQTTAPATQSQKSSALAVALARPHRKQRGRVAAALGEVAADGRHRRRHQNSAQVILPPTKTDEMSQSHSEPHKHATNKGQTRSPQRQRVATRGQVQQLCTSLADLFRLGQTQRGRDRRYNLCHVHHAEENKREEFECARRERNAGRERARQTERHRERDGDRKTERQSETQRDRARPSEKERAKRGANRSARRASPASTAACTRPRST